MKPQTGTKKRISRRVPKNFTSVKKPRKRPLGQTKKHRFDLKGGPFAGQSVYLQTGKTTEFTVGEGRDKVTGYYTNNGGKSFTLEWVLTKEADPIEYTVGDRIKPLKDIIEYVSEESPGGVLAYAGELLIIRGFSNWSKNKYYVSHEHITNNSFVVEEKEIRPYA